MSDLFSYISKLQTGNAKALPPVDQWNPEYCGEMDLVIKRDGAWIHEGTPIGRARLARLLSTVLKKEGDDYFLVTPAEKLKITVEDAPFIAVLMRIEGRGENQSLVFTTNLGDEIAAGADHPIEYRDDPETGGGAPYIEVRAGLKARIARAVFYDLVECGERRQTADSEDLFGVWSRGVFFPFGPADRIFEERQK